MVTWKGFFYVYQLYEDLTKSKIYGLSIVFIPGLLKLYHTRFLTLTNKLFKKIH